MYEKELIVVVIIAVAVIAVMHLHEYRKEKERAKRKAKKASQQSVQPEIVVPPEDPKIAAQRAYARQRLRNNALAMASLKYMNETARMYQTSESAKHNSQDEAWYRRAEWME